MSDILNQIQVDFLSNYLGWKSSAIDPSKSDAGSQADAWIKIQADLEARVQQALKDGLVADASGLRARWQFAIEQADSKNYDAALKAVPGIETLLEAVAAKSDSGFSVVAFQRSRIIWLDTKKRMLSEVGKLANAVVAQSSDDEDAAEIAKASQEMTEMVRAIDTRLEDVLDQITTADTPRRRDNLKSAAINVIREYQGLLGTSFFSLVDSNPFTSVSITSNAKQSLSIIANTLK